MKLHVLALATGTASAFAFEPVGWWPLMPLAFVALCELVNRAQSLRQALLAGWLFGLGQFVVGLNWIATAFTFQAAMPAWLGWVAVVLLSLYLAVYPLLATGLAWRIGRGRPVALVLSLAGGWAVTEWLRAGIFTGFAWNPVAATLVDLGLVLPAVRWLGTYGLSGLLVAAAGLAWLFLRRLVVEFRSKPLTPARLAIIIALFVLPEVVLVAMVPLLALAPAPPAAPEAGRAIRVVQPNIGQQDKWRPGFEEVAARRLDLLTIKGRPAPRLVFWPEAAVTEPLVDERTAARWDIETERLRATRSLGPDDVLLTGGLGLTARNRRNLDGATNSVFVMGPQGRITGRYDKAHLVPYGEYLPMRPLLSAIGLSRLAPGDLDFAAGPGPRTVALPGNWGKVGFQICYEIIFSGEVVDKADRPDFIFNPSNDAWFGRWGPPQHLAQARLRAAEEGLPVIRSTPTGISALIDADGRLLKSLPWQTAGIIDATLPPARAPTLFARAGNSIPVIFGLILIVVGIAVGRRHRYSADDI